MTTDLSFTDRVAQYFQARPHVWIDGLTLAQLGGSYAWRSRISDARRAWGMTIENRQRRVGRRVISEYCYRPTEGQQRLEMEAR